MGLGNLLRSCLSGQQTSGQQTSGQQTSGQQTSGQHEGLGDMPVWVHEELPILALRVFTDVGVPVVPPVIDQPVQRIMDGLIFKDKRMDEVSVFSWPICDPLIHIGTWDIVRRKSHIGWNWSTDFFCRLIRVYIGLRQYFSEGVQHVIHWYFFKSNMAAAAAKYH